MKWFSGSIGEAISSTQRNKTVFVAFIQGSTDNESKMMSDLFEDNEVRELLESGPFACIKLDAASTGYRQIVEIYRRAPIPSLFFISHSGVPLAIVEGSLCDDPAEAKAEVLKAAEYSKKKNSLLEPLRNMAGDKLLEERRQQVDAILSKNRERKNQKARGDRRMKEEESRERERRNDLDSEMHKLAEERLKEKREEALARQKILDQIAQDKAERAERMRLARSSAGDEAASVSSSDKAEVAGPSTSSPSLATPSIERSETRIQFKLPTGESKINMFKNTATLSEVRSYIDGNLTLEDRDYRLACPYPRREFAARDGERTLSELGLAPTGVLLIIPRDGVVKRHTAGWMEVLSSMVQDLLKPVYSIAGYLRGLLWGGGQSGATSSSTGPRQQPSSSSSDPQQRSQQPRRQVKKAGNIHSLRDLRDDNDENNTWNGNSTQQM